MTSSVDDMEGHEHFMMRVQDQINKGDVKLEKDDISQASNASKGSFYRAALAANNKLELADSDSMSSDY
jgi:hypothetical protein